jgi:tRNA (cmo5U34)-methyltransferase
MEKDQIYSLPLHKVGDFQFDERVVNVFGDMIQRSVPGYGSILSMIGELAEKYAQPASHLYDLGCSLGACTLVMRPRVHESCTIHSVDSSEAMVAAFSSRLARIGESARTLCSVEVHCEDIRRWEMSQASFSVLNFTLQFVPQPEREALLRSICESTLPGGALVLSEKIRFSDPHQEELMVELHHAFKRANGYSDLEIAQKRTALEKTLIPETLQTHLERLERVGFRSAVCWFQCFNFVSMLAVK